MLAKPQALLIRADANPRRGTGHIMRCLALAQGWQGHGRVVFACAEVTPALAAVLEAEGCQLQHLDAPPGSRADATLTVALARKLGTAWLVLDGYQFDSGFQHAVKEAGLRLLSFDDYGHVPDPCADLVLNQNLGATAALYPRRSANTRLLLGTRYALLRKEFLAWRGWQRHIPDVARKVIVTLGGADLANVTALVVQALEGLDIEAKIIVGGSNPNFASLAAAIKPPASVLRDVSNMAEMMAWADVAVSGGGSTSWELAFMGLPSLVVILAENQAQVAKELESSGASICIGEGFSNAKLIHGALKSILADRESREQMSAHARSLVDGYGPERVMAELRAPFLALRTAMPADCRRVWEWANDPTVRRVSFNTDPIAWESHQRWFETRLRDANCVFLIVEDADGIPFGQVRFEVKHDEAIISVSLDSRYRGRGLGPAIIRTATHRLIAERPVRLVRAFTKPENKASIQAFEHAGFMRKGLTTVESYRAIELTFQHNE